MTNADINLVISATLARLAQERNEGQVGSEEGSLSPSAGSSQTGAPAGETGAKAGPAGNTQTKEGATGTQTGTQVPGKGGKEPQDLSSCLIQQAPFIGGFILLFYFLMIRPQKKQEAKRKELLGALKKGDKVITNSGIHGEIAEVREGSSTLVLKFGNDAGQRFKIERAAVTRIKGKDGTEPKEDTGAK